MTSPNQKWARPDVRGTPQLDEPPSADTQFAADPLEPQISAAERSIAIAGMAIDLAEVRVSAMTGAVARLRALARTRGFVVDVPVVEPVISSPASTTPIGVVEAAALIGVDRNTLYELLKRGEGPPHRRLGSKILLDRAALLEWFRAGETPSIDRRRRSKR